MFVCLEVNTDDIILWEQIEKMMANEFGLTTVLWGVEVADSAAKVPSKSILPKNLFYGYTAYDNTQETCDTFNDMIEEEIRKLGVEDLRVITILHKAWTTRTIGNMNKPLPKASYIDPEEIVGREG